MFRLRAGPHLRFPNYLLPGVIGIRLPSAGVRQETKVNPSGDKVANPDPGWLHQAPSSCDGEDKVERGVPGRCFG